MDDELKLLLKLILEREEKAEEEKKTAKKRGRPVSEPAVTEKQPEKEETGKLPHTQAEYRERDLTLARRELYPAHDSNIDLMKDVPIWAKYALTVPEAAKYFHLGINKLHEIIRRDKYAEYLLWNGGRVYFKRELFEKYLNGDSKV